MPDALREAFFCLIHKNLSVDTVQGTQGNLLSLASRDVDIVWRSRDCVLAAGEEREKDSCCQAHC